MLIGRRRGWEIPESRVTPESVVVGRRGVIAAGGALAAAGLALRTARADAMQPNAKYPPGRAITPEKDATTYNNFYEFSTDKDLWRDAQALKQRPWTLKIDGLVSKKQEMGVDDLLKRVAAEERIYRHRCVEAWAMTVPWDGFPLSALLKIADPLSSAKYVRFETAQDPSMPGLNAPFYPWPYVEALTMEEAANDVAFISTGMYGKPLPPQNGGPIRLTVPWKYGFKSGKSLTKISFVADRPATMWAQIAPDEYGFWANVNPAVPHPRWSQATERLLGSGERVPTVIYNGYGPFVASMYADKSSEKLFM